MNCSSSSWPVVRVKTSPHLNTRGACLQLDLIQGSTIVISHGLMDSSRLYVQDSTKTAVQRTKAVCVGYGCETSVHGVVVCNNTQTSSKLDAG